MSNCTDCKEPRGKACHCAACHNNFATLTLFDKHQDVKYDRNPVVRCKNPEKLGLVLDTWNTWRTPENLVVTTNRVSAMNTARVVRKRND